MVHDDEQIIGFVGLASVPESGQSDINTIAVSPSARNRGLGAALLQRAIDTAAVAGGTPVASLIERAGAAVAREAVRMRRRETALVKMLNPVPRLVIRRPARRQRRS